MMSMEVRREVALAPLTTYKIGGQAQWYAAPQDEASLRAALAFAGERGLRVWIIGRGSNVLIADAGLRGLVIDLRQFAIWTHVQDGLLWAGAGVSLPRLARSVADLGYTGYEFYIGIPGTVGGAVVMNAGYGPTDARQTAARCRVVTLMDLAGQVESCEYAALRPAYRRTDLQDGQDRRRRIVLAAGFGLETRAERALIRAETAKQLAMRKALQPLTRPTAGSIFRATAAGEPAALLIEKCGLKGARCGGAMVSHKHANWIENTGGARAEDVLQLIKQVQATVLESCGVALEPEVLYLGGD